MNEEEVEEKENGKEEGEERKWNGEENVIIFE